MATKLTALWILLTSPHYLLLTTNKTIGVVPKSGKEFELMLRIGEVLQGKAAPTASPQQPKPLEEK